MRREIGLTLACLIGGWMALALVGALGLPAQAAPAAPAADPGDVVINEVAWMGTSANYRHEWIELHNVTSQTVDLSDWTLGDSGGTFLTLTGTVHAGGYYLVARYSTTFSGTMPTIDQLHSGNLRDGGEVITLTASGGQVVDTANSEKGYDAGWAAGDKDTDHTMERIDPAAPDTDANWSTNDGLTRNGFDADENPINGTPKAENSCYQPPVGENADLVVEKVGPASARAEQIITYTLTISNRGAITATAVRVTDTLPAAVDFITQASAYTFQERDGLLTWSLGDLPTETLGAITITARVSPTSAVTVVNRVTATTTASEVVTPNVAAWETRVLPEVWLYALEPANFAGLSGEAVALINMAAQTVSLDGWWVNDRPKAEGVTFPSTATIAPGQILWIAQDADDFFSAWGVDADWSAATNARSVPVLGGAWETYFFTDDGEEAYLLDEAGHVVDALVYGDELSGERWQGPAVPYKYSGFADGQVIYRKLDQATGRPVADTDTAADWAQDGDDPINGRRIRFPGWDLEELFFPAEISATAHVTLAVAPEGTLNFVSQTLASAQEQILFEGYTFESVPLYEVISDRIQAGVAVTMVLDSAPAGEGVEDVERWIVQRLHNPPTSTVYFMGETAPRYKFQHAKFVLVDGHTALVSTDNFGESSMPSDRIANGTLGHRGFVVATDSPGVIDRLRRIFQLDCDPLHHLDVAAYDSGYAPPPDFVPLPPPDWTTYTVQFTQTVATTATHITVLHAPENVLRDEDGLLGLLGRAEAGDRIATMQLNEPFTWTAEAGEAGLNPRLQSLIAAARNGADVRLLLDGYYDQHNTATCVRLDQIAEQEAMSLTCRLANVTGLGIHAKLFLADVGGERWVHVGSINGSETSNKANREVALQFRSPEAYAWTLDVFDADWARGHGPMIYQTYLPLVMQGYVPPADYPLISEVMVNPRNDSEWIELYNPGPTLSIAGWAVGDAIDLGAYGDGRYAFPAGAELAHDQVLVVAASAQDFATAHGRNPDYEWGSTVGEVPDLSPVGSWEGFGLVMGNESDEVLLLNGSGSRVDSLAWGGSARVGVSPFTAFTDTLPWGGALRRWPVDVDTDDCAQDFYVTYNPRPGE